MKIKTYSDPLKDVEAIVSDCLRHGFSEGWSGSIDQRNACAGLLEPYWVVYVDDLRGRWEPSRKKETMGTKELKTYASFEDVKAFFKSWGLYPGDTDEEEIIGDGLNPVAITHGLNRRCFDKLLKESGHHIHSSSHQDYFTVFCAQQIGEQDDQYYLEAETWEELKEDWEDYLLSL